jgi:hypothetical protein
MHTENRLSFLRLKNRQLVRNYFIVPGGWVVRIEHIELMNECNRVDFVVGKVKGVVCYSLEDFFPRERLFPTTVFNERIAVLWLVE